MPSTLPPNPPDIRNAPIALWRSAGHFLRTILGLFGEPQDIAAQHTLTDKAYKLTLSWVRVAEAFVRQLLLIEAAALPRATITPRARITHTRQRRMVFNDPATPEAWRLSFHALYGASPPRPRSRAATRTPQTARRFHSAWPLAERVEALLRAYDTPAPYAARLARRLFARPARAARLRAEPAHFEHRIDADIHAALRTLGAAAARVFADSS
jgi:hypothetical protein